MGRQNLHFVMPLVHELRYQKVVLCVVVAKLLPHVSITLKKGVPKGNCQVYNY